MTIENDFIWAKDETSESKIATKEIEKLVELNNHYLVKLIPGQSIVIPKGPSLTMNRLMRNSEI